VDCYKIGIIQRLHPINLHDESDTCWLQALIWPEHKNRHKLLKAALEVAQQQSLKIVAGDAANTLPDVLANLPDNATVCVFHSYVFSQLPQELREHILMHLLEYSNQHDLFRISQEWLEGWEKPRIELFSYHKGEIQSELLAYSESHGRWVEWLQQ
jgi:hypothetical protein